MRTWLRISLLRLTMLTCIKGYQCRFKKQKKRLISDNHWLKICSFYLFKQYSCLLFLRKRYAILGADRRKGAIELGRHHAHFITNLITTHVEWNYHLRVFKLSQVKCTHKVLDCSIQNTWNSDVQYTIHYRVILK